jgi:hypothetical protein
MNGGSKVGRNRKENFALDFPLLQVLALYSKTPYDPQYNFFSAGQCIKTVKEYF